MSECSSQRCVTAQHEIANAGNDAWHWSPTSSLPRRLPASSENSSARNQQIPAPPRDCCATQRRASATALPAVARRGCRGNHAARPTATEVHLSSAWRPEWIAGRAGPAAPSSPTYCFQKVFAQTSERSLAESFRLVRALTMPRTFPTPVVAPTRQTQPGLGVHALRRRTTGELPASIRRSTAHAMHQRPIAERFEDDGVGDEVIPAVGRH